MQIVTSEYNESKKMGVKVARKCKNNAELLRYLQRAWEAQTASWDTPGHEVEYSRAKGYLDGMLEVAK